MTSPYPGWFVVFEGGDNVGKTTHVELAKQALEEAGIHVVATYEPGDTALGENIRKLLLDPASGDIDPRAEALLYAADKAQHLHQVVIPALQQGAVVLCDRYVDSMLAYQGAGRVLEVNEVTQIADWATQGLHPDLTVLLDRDVAQGVEQISDKDRLEQAGIDFHQRVRQEFKKLSNDHDRDFGEYLTLNTAEPLDSNAADVRNALSQLGIPGLS